MQIQKGLLIVLLAVVCGCTPPRPTETGTVSRVESSAVPSVESQPEVATQPVPSRWHVTPAGRYQFVESFNDRYLWLRGGGVDRYDMQTRRRLTFTDVDGLPLSGDRHPQRIAAGCDGRGIVLFEYGERIFHYTDATGWRRLPVVDSTQRVRDIAFDSDGQTVVALTSHPDDQRADNFSIFRLVGRTWEKFVTVDQKKCSGLAVLNDCYVVKVYDGGSWLVRVDKADGQTKRIGDYPIDENGMRTVRVNGRCYFAKPEHRESRGRESVMHTVRELTRDGVIATERKTPLMLDLQTGNFTPITVTGDAPGPLIVDIPGIVRWEQERDWGSWLFPLRDRNGDIWMSNRVYRNGAWQEMPNRRNEVSGLFAMDDGRGYFDDAEQRWRYVIPHEYRHFRIVDIDQKLAWAVKEQNSMEMFLLDFSQRPPQVIQALPRLPRWGLPMFRDSAGTWFLIGQTIVSIDAKGTVTDYGLAGVDLWLGPRSGRVYTNAHPHYWRLDPKGKFFQPVPQAALLDEFAFEAGGREWAILPLRYQLSTTMLYRKVDGKWIGVATYAARRGDRIMMCTGGRGTWEYDATNNRWVMLHRWLSHLAFDDKGRRVLGSHQSILIYDGDPFDDPRYLRQDEKKQIETETAQLAAAIDAMKTENPDAEKEAVEWVKALSPRMTFAVQLASEDPRLPPRVRQLLAGTLPNVVPGDVSLAGQLVRAHVPTVP